MTSRKRIIAFDALRVFAIVSVVAIHSLIPYRSLLPDGAPIRLFDDLLHYAVPLFVFISGAFVWARPLPRHPGAFRSFLSRRFGVVGIPYIAWSAVFFALLVALSIEAPHLKRTLGLLLTGHTWYHLYFIPMLLAFYLLTPLASSALSVSPEAFVVACYALRIFYGLTIALAFKRAFGTLGYSYAMHIINHLPEMALGAWFALRQQRIRHKGLLAAGLLPLGLFALSALSRGVSRGWPGILPKLAQPGGMAATILGMALLALVLESVFERAKHSIQQASNLSFGVYFVHPLYLLLVFEAVRVASKDSLWLQPWFLIAVFAGVLAASFATAWAIAQSHLTCRLVGLARPLRPAAGEPAG